MCLVDAGQGPAQHGKLPLFGLATEYFSFSNILSLNQDLVVVWKQSSRPLEVRNSLGICLRATWTILLCGLGHIKLLVNVGNIAWVLSKKYKN